MLFTTMKEFSKLVNSYHKKLDSTFFS